MDGLNTSVCGFPQTPLISVVVCTYNRAELLENAVQSLCDQTLDKSQYEILIVDNSSTDNTRAVAAEFRCRYPNVRYCFEPQQGLSNARNCGWRTARGDYVAYVDDDCRMPNQWLQVTREVIREIGPGVFGGPYHPFYNSSKPPWFQDRYGSHDLGDEGRAVRNGEYLTGGNIVIRRSLLEATGGFDPRLGRRGSKLGSGEETALILLIRNSMPDELIYYEPKLHVYHLVAPRKMTLRWNIRHRFAGGRDSFYLVGRAGHQRFERAGALARAGRALMLFGWDAIRGVVMRDREQYPHQENYLYERTFVHLWHLGRAFEQLRQPPKPR